MAKRKTKKKPLGAPGLVPAGPAPTDIERPAGPAGWLLSPRRQTLGAAVFLAVLAGLAYANSFQAEWHLDDTTNITQNYFIRINSLTPSTLLQAMVQDRKQNRPFSNLSFALNYYFSGEQVWGYHLVNWAFHLLASLAAFSWIRRTLRLAGLAEPSRDLAALAAAALWAVHPIHTQAVTYIVQRQTVMASSLILVTLAAYAAAREAVSSRRKRILYAATVLAWVLALGSKEIAVVTPGFLILYEFCFFQKGSFAFLRRRARALAAVLGIFGVLGLIYLRPEIWSLLARSYQHYSFTPAERLMTEARVLVYYVVLILWPLPAWLSLEHDPAISTSLFHPWTTLPAVLLWTALLGVSLRFARSRPFFSFAVLWYLGNLFLESSFLPLDLFFEHRLYLPSLAVVTPLAVALVFGLRRFSRLRSLLLASILCFLLISTLVRNQVWQTDLGLYRDCVRKSPFQVRSRVNLAKAYLDAGQYQRSQIEYEKSISLGSKSAEAHNGLGEIALREGQTDRAWQLFQASLQIRPNADAFIGLGNVHYYREQYDQAIPFFSKALELDPYYPEAYNDRGNCYRRLNHYEEAVRDYTRAVELNPNYAEAYNNRGNAQADQGRLEPAAADYSQALALRPQYAEAFYNRGNAYAQQGEYDRALEDYRRALTANPDFAEAYIGEGLAWRMKGRADLALKDFNRALELNPDQIQALKNRALLYRELGQEDRAEDDLQRLRDLTSP